METGGETSVPSADFVQSLARGLAVIRAFDAEHPRLSLSDVAKRTELSAAAARRFLRTLEALDYVRSHDRLFELTPKVLELGYGYLSALSLPEVMQPHLRALSNAVGESVSAAVLDRGEIVYIARAPMQRVMRVSITLGTRFPAYATSMGRVLLAELDDAERDLAFRTLPPVALTAQTRTGLPELEAELARVRADGFAVVDGELEAGLRSVAAPVRDVSGRAVAALNVSASATRISVAELRERLAPLAVSTAATIASELRLQSPADLR